MFNAITFYLFLIGVVALLAGFLMTHEPKVKLIKIEDMDCVVYAQGSITCDWSEHEKYHGQEAIDEDQ